MTVPVIFVGAGGHALACADIVESDKDLMLSGFVVDDADPREEIWGYPVVGRDAEIESLVEKFPEAFVAIGFIEDSKMRKAMIERLLQAGFRFPTVVASSSCCSSRALIGSGAIVMNSAVVNAGARISDFCIINSMALVEHGVKVGKNSHVSTRVTLNGEVTVGENCFVGSGSVIRNGVNIGSDSFIGMGSLITADVPPGSRIVRKNI